MGGIQNTQCGFKAYRIEAIKQISKKLYLFNLKNAQTISRPAVAAGFDVEVLYVATLLGYKIKEVPVVRDYKMSRRVNLVNDAIKGVKELLLLKYLKIKRVYK